MRAARQSSMRAWLLLVCVSAWAQVSVLTYHNDLARTGQNLAEPALTPAALSSSRFGPLFSHAVDGYVYAQPLYLPGVFIPGKGPHNVVYVVTEHDSVYAFDGDSAAGLSADPLWHVSFINPAAGVTTVPYQNVGCSQIVPEIGITGTPVIDPSTGTLYVVAMTLENGTYVHRLHGLDIATGVERPGSPVQIQAPGFVAHDYKQRPGLLLLNGQVYTSWSSHCDIGTYHGYVIAYDASTLRQTAVYNDTPNGNEASFWAGGAAPAADPAGNIYLMGGNGTFDANTGGADLGDSFIRLSTTAGALTPADYFTPFNVQDLNDRDLDIGSAGPVLLPNEAGSAAHPHLLVGAGKEGRIYLLDRDNMGKFQPGADSQIPQSIVGAIGALFGIPAYYNNTVYFSGANDHLKAFSIHNAQLSNTAVSQSAESYTYPGSTPVISANGAANGIVWNLEITGNGTLHAYDAADLSKELYHDSSALGSYVKFSSPTVANGRVYAGTQNNIVTYGLSAPAGASMGVVNGGSFQLGAVAPGSAISLFANFGVAAAQPAERGLPLWLNLVTVRINGVLAPLYYVGPLQINAQVPFETPTGQVPIAVSIAGADVVTGTLSVQARAPGLFTVGPGRAAVRNQDGSVNSTSNPAAVGTIVSAYLTGQGAVQPAVQTGSVAPGKPFAQVDNVTATVGGQPAEVKFAGLSPGSVGLFQVNLRVPNVAAGDEPLVITVAGNPSNSELMTVAAH